MAFEKRKRKPEGDAEGGANPMAAKRLFFRRSRACPLSQPNVELDYKNIKLLSRFVSERGRILPSRITSVSSKKQSHLAKEIKRARQLGLLAYVAD